MIKKNSRRFPVQGKKKGRGLKKNNFRSWGTSRTNGETGKESRKKIGV